MSSIELSKEYHQLQAWLNLQSSPDELWDVLDENRNLTGRTHRRADPMQDGDFHLTVHIWIRRSNGKFLLTKRAPNKGYPLMWETTAGSAISGDDSLTAALREVREETGLILDPEKGRLVLSTKSDHQFADIWFFHHEFSLSDVVLLEGETCDCMAATKEQILQMDNDGVLVPFSYLNEFLNTI